MKTLLLLCLVTGPLMACRAARPDTPRQSLALNVPAGVEGSAMDWSTRPCDDFFQFSCGAWAQRTEIPADRAVWFIYGNIDDSNELALKKILDDASAGALPVGTAYAKQLGDFHATCMDEPRLETSLPELNRLLARVDRLKSAKDVGREIAAMAAMGLNPLFHFGSEQDPDDAAQVIAYLDQGGLGLPDRDYYFGSEPKMKEVRGLYQRHLQHLLEMLGRPAASAQESASAILAVETELARASMDKVSHRDPIKTYHRMNLQTLSAGAPGFSWVDFLTTVGAPPGGAISVTHLPFLHAATSLLSSVPVSTWKSLLTVRYVIALTPALPRRFQEERFAFTRQALTGAQSDLPRWKKCVHFADQYLGEALARPFVSEVFDGESKRATVQMVADIERSFEENLPALSWMDAPTRVQALEKLKNVANKVGYPDRWRNYDALQTDRTSFLKNLLRAERFEQARDIQKIGKPVDRTEWGMTPPTVNAQYDPTLNEITLPAGILQPPLFRKDYAAAYNYGSTGASTVGHELTHGFDDEGRHYDARGNLRDWWTKDASKAFDARAQCVTKQFDQYVAVDDIHVNGALTLGENIADLGGLKLGYAAFTRSSKGAAPSAKPERLTPEQTFFVGYAQAWCGKYRPELLRVVTASNPHSPPVWRVNGPVSNLKSFQEAFACKAGDKMVAAHPCEVW